MGSVTNFPRRAKGGVAFEPAPKKAEPGPVVDIYANWRAEIAARDWDGVQVISDRRPPVEINDRPRRFILDALSLKAKRRIGGAG